MSAHHTSNKSKIIDNRHRGTVEAFLRSEIENGSSLSIVSAYFTIHAFDALRETLEGIKELKFLFGAPDFIKSLDPQNTDEKTYKIVDTGLELSTQLQQKPIAKACAEWIKEKVQIRSTRQSNLLHGKMYHILNNGKPTAIMGSSNFTMNGLGLNPTGNNIELNMRIADEKDCDELKEWFDEIWEDTKHVEDVKAEVLAALNRLGKDHAPEFIYYKTLYELFGEELEARRNNDQKLEDTHLYDTEIWKQLYGFQKEGARSVIARLLAHNGCILADSVGLGKTYTALAVIKFFELQNDRVLVLCPKKLRENWALFPVYNAQKNNPFVDDKFGYSLLSHTDLSRYSGRVGDTDLANFNWRNFDLVVIDESHNFRNDTKPIRDDDDNVIRHSRYTRLLEEVIKEGTKTKVLMLSATPVNTSLLDLRNQIYLMTEKREDVFRDSLEISDIRAVLGQAQKKFKEWEDTLDERSGRDKSKLLVELGADFFKLLGGVSIARSRRQIKQFYTEEISRIGEFPKQRKPINHHPLTDLNGELSYTALSDQIAQFALSIYRPSSYVTGADAKRRLEKEKAEKRFNQADRERFLIGMIRTNFLKRLESSAHSLTETLGRTIGKIDDLLEKIDRYEQQRTAAEADHLQDDDILPDDDDDDDDFLVNRARHPYHLRELDCSRWKADLIKDKLTLTKAYDSVKAITPERDGKLETIKEHIRDKAQNPKTDRDGKTNRKLLVFTTFKDTGVYLYENLSNLASELGLNMALVSGDATRTTFGENNFNAILTNFAPRARMRETNGTDEIDLLLATDCISEGQNLQDCDTVLNYDIHWNPVRIIQRFGRVDRIGSNNQSVGMINYWPTELMRRMRERRPNGSDCRLRARLGFC